MAKKTMKGAENAPKPRCRGRNFTAIYYPESEEDEDNFLDIAFHRVKNTLKCKKLIYSPIHFKETGEIKAHRHLLAIFKNPVSLERLNEFFAGEKENCEYLKRCTRWERVSSYRKMIRYFVHLDNPEKQQFSVEIIKNFRRQDKLCKLAIQRICDDELILVFRDLIQERKCHTLTELTNALELMEAGDEEYSFLKKNWSLLKTFCSELSK